MALTEQTFTRVIARTTITNSSACNHLGHINITIHLRLALEASFEVQLRKSLSPRPPAWMALSTRLTSEVSLQLYIHVPQAEFEEEKLSPQQSYPI